MEENTYTFSELKEKYPPRMRDVDELKKQEAAALGPLDYLYIDDWQDLSLIGADLHKLDRKDCKDDVNNYLDIQFVVCTYDNKYNDEKQTKLEGSLVAIVPYSSIDIGHCALHNQLVKIMEERGYGNRGNKTKKKKIDEETE